jgi:protein involved in polysaccharide export with SLBB domain
MIGQPDLSRDYVVDANGDIQVTYVGKIRVGGLTVEQAQQVIAARMRKIYHDVSLTVNRTALGGVSVTVTGAVAKTGPLSIRRDARLNDVVQQLSPMPDADLNHVQISRSQDPSLIADLGSYLETGNPSGNPAVKDGDVIFVPSKPKAVATTIAVSVVGAVPRPGRFDVAPGTTAYDAVTMAGGLASSADQKSVYVQPIGQTTHKSLIWTDVVSNPGSPDANPVLRDGDKIVVPEAAQASTFSIMGGVRTPNTYPLKGNITLFDAISMAGGFDKDAKAKDITVTRATPMGVTTVNVNGSDPNQMATFMVQPNDHIIVPMAETKSGGFHPDPLAVIGVAITLFSILRR